MLDKRWDNLLVNDHEMIERIMDMLKLELEKLPHDMPDLYVMKRSIDFLLEFGDRIHNKKEEEFLFPLMIKRGIPQDGPIRVMLMEHDSERELLTEMNMMAPELTNLSEDKKANFKHKGLEYLEIRANHIWKENDILYNMGRQRLTEEDNDYLIKNFDKINQESYGENAEEHFSRMVIEIEKGKKAVKSLIHNLNIEQIDAIFESLPVEITFVDANDTVAYFNRLDKDKIFVRTRSVVGRKIQKCHPEKSLHIVEKIVDGFKNDTMKDAEFWIDYMGDKVYIRYLPVRDENGTYLGVIEVTQEIGKIQKLTGEKKLLD